MSDDEIAMRMSYGQEEWDYEVPEESAPKPEKRGASIKNCSGRSRSLF